MTDLFDRPTVDDLDAHFLSTPIHDQVRRDLRATWLQQKPISDTEFAQAADEAVEVSRWDRVESVVTGERWAPMTTRQKIVCAIVAFLSLAVFLYTGLAYVDIAPVVQR